MHFVYSCGAGLQMKARRQAVILEVIDREALHSQEELRRRLQQRGFDATQATISRDIAELGLVKRALGQGRVLEEVRDRALAAGAVRAHVLDAREEFAANFIVRALKADAVYEDRYPMATSLGRPLIAKKLVEVADIEQASTVAHCGTGNDQIRLEVGVRALNPSLAVLAVPPAAPSAQSVDANLWGRAIQYGDLKDA